MLFTCSVPAEIPLLYYIKHTQDFLIICIIDMQLIELNLLRLNYTDFLLHSSRY